jgi:hypothetical protein
MLTKSQIRSINKNIKNSPYASRFADWSAYTRKLAELNVDLNEYEIIGILRSNWPGWIADEKRYKATSSNLCDYVLDTSQSEIEEVAVDAFPNYNPVIREIE